jgi:hypothetical protein
VPLERLEVGILDDEELAFRHLEPAHDLVLRHLAVVRRAPALLLDRRLALAVQQSEGDVGLTCGRLRRGSEPDGNRDEAEAE